MASLTAASAWEKSRYEVTALPSTGGKVSIMTAAAARKAGLAPPRHIIRGDDLGELVRKGLAMVRRQQSVSVRWIQGQGRPSDRVIAELSQTTKTPATTVRPQKAGRRTKAEPAPAPVSPDVRMAPTDIAIALSELSRRVEKLELTRSRHQKTVDSVLAKLSSALQNSVEEFLGRLVRQDAIINESAGRVSKLDARMDELVPLINGLRREFRKTNGYPPDAPMLPFADS
jgi:hypothetical protein